MDLNVNDGTRLSKLQLGRYAAGELTDAESAEVEARLDDADRAWLAEVQDAKDSLLSFDPGSLRARASSQTAEAPLHPQAANTTVWFGLVALLAALVLGFLLVGSPTDPAEIDPNYIGARGAVDAIQVHVWTDGALHPWEGEAVGEGDRLGFQVDATGRNGVVLLSVDGNGQVSVFWPESGNAPEPLDGDGLVKLPGSLTLDGAPGPEVFLAVFDHTATEAVDNARRLYQSGGPEALTEWAERADHVEAVVLERR